MFYFEAFLNGETDYGKPIEFVVWNGDLVVCPVRRVLWGAGR